MQGSNAPKVLTRGAFSSHVVHSCSYLSIKVWIQDDVKAFPRIRQDETIQLLVIQPFSGYVWVKQVVCARIAQPFDSGLVKGRHLQLEHVAAGLNDPVGSEALPICWHPVSNVMLACVD